MVQEREILLENASDAEKGGLLRFFENTAPIKEEERVRRLWNISLLFLNDVEDELGHFRSWEIDAARR